MEDNYIIDIDSDQERIVFDKEHMRIIQIGNLLEDKNFKNPQVGRVYSTDGLCPTIDTMGGGNRQPKILDPNYLKIRKLTPRECWRLMGFDDSDIDKCIAAGISNTQLYKMAGNSIVVPVLQAILEEVYRCRRS